MMLSSVSLSTPFVPPVSSRKENPSAALMTAPSTVVDTSPPQFGLNAKPFAPLLFLLLSFLTFQCAQETSSTQKSNAPIATQATKEPLSKEQALATIDQRIKAYQYGLNVDQMINGQMTLAPIYQGGKPTQLTLTNYDSDALINGIHYGICENLASEFKAELDPLLTSSYKLVFTSGNSPKIFNKKGDSHQFLLGIPDSLKHLSPNEIVSNIRKYGDEILLIDPSFGVYGTYNAVNKKAKGETGKQYIVTGFADTANKEALTTRTLDVIETQGRFMTYPYLPLGFVEDWAPSLKQQLGAKGLFAVTFLLDQHPQRKKAVWVPFYTGVPETGGENQFFGFDTHPDLYVPQTPNPTSKLFNFCLN